MSSLNNAVRRTLLRLGSAASLTDGDLLARFATAQEPAAFEELLRRHGPMVLRVCQRVLHHAQDAEDAFQATFIVLMHKARHIAKSELLGNWLYGVAYRTALNAKKRRACRPVTGAAVFEESLVTNGAWGGAATESMRRELSSELDEALQRLPAMYRAPIVLCYLQGKSNEEAARLLQCEISAVRVRLFRARDMLRSRLARQGMVYSAATLTALLARETASAVAAVPLKLASVTACKAALATSGQALGGATLTSPVVLLAEATLRSMAAAKVKAAAAVLLGALVFLGGGLWLRSSDRHAGSFPAQAITSGQTINVGQVTGVGAAGTPGATLTQYEVRGGGNTNYNITVSFFSKAPLKAMTIKINDAVVSGPVPAAQAGLITYGGYNNDLGLAQPGALVTVWMLDALGREASLSYTIKPWP
jgi:RNA polymerase sigma factor (sigma-70 family)